MPIRPENRERYPADWPDISRHIRKQRAADRCECDGRCGTDHHGRCAARNGQPSPMTGSTVVLTVAHLDHQPENSGPANLMAACQACHLRYDAAHPGLLLLRLVGLRVRLPANSRSTPRDPYATPPPGGYPGGGHTSTPHPPRRNRDHHPHPAPHPTPSAAELVAFQRQMGGVS